MLFGLLQLLEFDESVATGEDTDEGQEDDVPKENIVAATDKKID